MRKFRQGFTLVELIVVIAIIAILATIGILGFSQYQADGRDATRSARATALSEALEKYYDTHGEYPSCSQLTQSSDIVRSEVLIGIDETALKTPSGNNNSISCDDLTDNSNGDYFAYVGDDSDACVGQDGSACVLYTLKYLEEGSGSIAIINSRRQTALTADAIPTLTSVSPTGVASANASWTAALGATRYELQYSKTLTFPSVDSPNTISGGTLRTTSLSSAITGLDYNSSYYFRVRATNATGPAGWSGTQTATTYSLGTPVVSSSVTSTQITITWPAISYSDGYTVEYAGNSSFTGSTTVNVTNPTHTITVATGTLQYFRVRATSGPFNGNWSATINATAVPAPVAPTVTRGTETSTSVAFSWPSQAYTTRYEYQTSINDGAWSSTQNTTNTSVTPTSTNGAKIEIQVRVVNPAGTSAWSAVATGYLIPSAPSVSCASITTSGTTCSWSAVTGAASYEYQTNINGGAWSSVASQTATSRAMSSGTEGTNLGIQVRSKNATGNVSAWSSDTATLLVSTPAWNTWTQTESYPYWYTRVHRTDNAALCASGMEMWSQFNEGISPGWNGWGAFSNRGVGANTTATYTSNVGSYYATLQVQLGGYCRNPTTGAVSSTIYSGVRTSVHTQPTINLSGPVTCGGTYSGRSAFQLRVTVQEVSYNLDANTSNVNWSIYRYAQTAGWQSYDQTKTWPWSANINGAGASGSSNSSRWRTVASAVGDTEGISSGTVTVGHDGNGNATIGFSGSDGPGSSIFGTGSCSGAYALSDLRP